MRSVRWRPAARCSAVPRRTSRTWRYARSRRCCPRAPIGAHSALPRRRSAAGWRDGSLPRRLAEIPQVGRGLILAGRHQLAVGAQEIVVLVDTDMQVVLGADDLAPGRTGFGLAPIVLGHGPRVRQRMIEHRDLV